MPLAGEHDELDAMFPLYTKPRPLPRCAQTEMVIARLRRNAAALRERGFSFGGSRLAVVAAPEDRRHCRDAGLCLYGCPYGSIYNSAQTLAQLIDDGAVDYRPGLYVDRLSEQGGEVRIDFHALGRPQTSGAPCAPRGRSSPAAVSPRHG